MRGQATCRSCLFAAGLILASDLRLDAFDVHSGRLQHQWHSSYRSWQATRNVFIYPENFMQPKMSSPKSKRCVHCR